ncbi:hypothetical protein BU14_0238s0030 [Porphyra umbilicalis]|uniref:Uncharacterized protein n=1 Tax=Porphyra umbilicalis TaxID=2786 RepID=A0A1X6P3K2_PORUM|nr:hypothetical protein BU14_0238s0030 [Porphyra umbilicalis]|eukprot:OSX75407.1 hypothetical protein BU14_0238s0030 [Porphyra umbilicalis]
MKVAIIGGNLCGAATAFCLSEVAACNRERRRRAGAPDADEAVEITIFEARDRLGGNKFIAHPLDGGGGAVEVGTVAAIPLAHTPLLGDLLARAGVGAALTSATLSPRPTAAGTSRSVGTYDYRRDAWAVCVRRSRWADAAARSAGACWLARAVGAAAVAVALALWVGPLPPPVRRHPALVAAALAVTVVTTGGGVLPPRRTLSAANTVATAAGARLTGFLAYGTSLSGVAAAVEETTARLTAVRTARAARRGVTLGHLLSRAGLARVATAAGAPWLAAHGVRADFVEEVVAPTLGLAGAGAGAGAGGTFGPSGGEGGGGGFGAGGGGGDLPTTSILALGVRLGELPLPAALAARARLSGSPAGLAAGLVGGLAAASGAAVALRSRVVTVAAPGGFGAYTLTLEGGGVAGPYDGVVLAAALRPGAMIDCPQLTGAASLAAALGYPHWVPPAPADAADAAAGGCGGGGSGGGGGGSGGGDGGDGGAWVGIVTGRLRPTVFNAATEEDVPDCVTVFGGGPLLRVDRVGVAAGGGTPPPAGRPRRGTPPPLRVPPRLLGAPRRNRARRHRHLYRRGGGGGVSAAAAWPARRPRRRPRVSGRHCRAPVGQRRRD